jgi:hypothetical protein
VEEAFKEALTSLQHDGKLFLTEDEWDARRKNREWKTCIGINARADNMGKGWLHCCGHDGSSMGGSLNEPTSIECRR